MIPNNRNAMWRAQVIVALKNAQIEKTARITLLETQLAEAAEQLATLSAMMEVQSKGTTRSLQDVLDVLIHTKLKYDKLRGYLKEFYPQNEGAIVEYCKVTEGSLWHVYKDVGKETSEMKLQRDTALYAMNDLIARIAGKKEK